MPKHVIDINGAIYPEQSAYASDWGVVSLATVKQSLSNISADADSLEVRINSPGGVVDEAFAIINEILLVAEDKGLKIVTVASGQVASAAVAIFLMAKSRKILSTSQLFVHNPFIDSFSLPWDGVEAKDLEQVAVYLRSEETRIVNYVVKQSGAEENVVRQLMNDSATISSDQALELKFATEIYEPVINLRKLVLNHSKSLNTKKMSLKNLVGAALKNLNAAAKSAGIALNMSATTKDGKTLEFSTETIEVGTDVTIDGVAATDGEYEMEDGTMISVKDGKVETVTPATTVEDNAALTEEVTNLRTENTRISSELAEATTMINSLVQTTNSLTDSLKNMKSGFKPEGRGMGATGTQKATPENKQTVTGSAVERAKAKAEAERKKASESK